VGGFELHEKSQPALLLHKEYRPASFLADEAVFDRTL
jgi:hypothetical protein